MRRGGGGIDGSGEHNPLLDALADGVTFVALAEALTDTELDYEWSVTCDALQLTRRKGKWG